MVAGMESMSTIPYLLKAGRWDGFRMGDQVLQDGWNDTRDVVCDLLMGQTAENLVEKYQISRQEQDEFALSSHRKAAEAQDAGWLDEEIVPVTIAASSKKPAEIFDKDEPIRKDTNLEQLARLAPAFKQGGSVTAGNSCGLSDGASSLVLMSRDKAKALGLKPLFSLLGYSSVGVANAYMGEGPGVAIPRALEKANTDLNDVDLFEVNEAFAAQACAVVKELALPAEKVNVNGGAVAIGHPIGASGARILVTLLYEMKRRGVHYGLAALCIGGGQGAALVVENVE
jgi:acetyl-CoA C-acetyltransferase